MNQDGGSRLFNCHSDRVTVLRYRKRGGHPFPAHQAAVSAVVRDREQLPAEIALETGEQGPVGEDVLDVPLTGAARTDAGRVVARVRCFVEGELAQIAHAISRAYDKPCAVRADLDRPGRKSRVDEFRLCSWPPGRGVDRNAEQIADVGSRWTPQIQCARVFGPAHGIEARPRVDELGLSSGISDTASLASSGIGPSKGDVESVARYRDSAQQFEPFDSKHALSVELRASCLERRRVVSDVKRVVISEHHPAVVAQATNADAVESCELAQIELLARLAAEAGDAPHLFVVRPRHQVDAPTIGRPGDVVKRRPGARREKRLAPAPVEVDQDHPVPIASHVHRRAAVGCEIQPYRVAMGATSARGRIDDVARERDLVDVWQWAGVVARVRCTELPHGADNRGTDQCGGEESGRTPPMTARGRFTRGRGGFSAFVGICELEACIRGVAHAIGEALFQAAP